jgi:hypothetical protein
MFHSSGDEAQDRKKDDMRRFFQQIDRALMKEVLAESQLPLVLACVDYLKPIYADANSYRNLLSEGVSGNPDEAQEKQLGAQAWEVVERYYQDKRQEDSTRFGNQIGAGLSSTDLEEIVLASIEGRIETVWLSQQEQLWGRMNANDGLVSVEVHAEKSAEDEDLLDLVAVKTLLTSGRIYAVDPAGIPGRAQMAAILRY